MGLPQFGGHPGKTHPTHEHTYIHTHTHYTRKGNFQVTNMGSQHTSQDFQFNVQILCCSGTFDESNLLVVKEGLIPIIMTLPIYAWNVQGSKTDNTCSKDIHLMFPISQAHLTTILGEYFVKTLAPLT